jgi:hypothetical protein
MKRRSKNLWSGFMGNGEEFRFPIFNRGEVGESGGAMKGNGATLSG